MKILGTAILCLCCLVGISVSQEPDEFLAPAIDTTVIASDSINIDSLIWDSIAVLDSLLPDSLSPAERAQKLFELRYRLMQELRPREEKHEPLSYFDSLIVYFTSTTMNSREVIDRSFYHDAGDYFKFNPGFFIVEHQITPMRKTVQPYGVNGDRLGIVLNGTSVHPFEHNVEPDGLIDMNDIPTALDDLVMLMPGPSGVIFGSDRGVATLLTRPKVYDDFDAHSSFLVDKGQDGYSYARARYNRRFADGRRILFSVGYRNADGLYPGLTDDDAYHYNADFYIPAGKTYAVQVAGRLYDRVGPILVQPAEGLLASLNRDRFDRSLTLSLIRHHPKGGENRRLMYRHRRESSNLEGTYTVKFNNTGHGVTAARQWRSGTMQFETKADGDYLEYDYGGGQESRCFAGASLSMADLSDGWRYSLRVQPRWVEGFDLVPSAALSLVRQGKHAFVMFSGGYVVREPSLLELYLPLRSASIYGISGVDYADRGNPDLKTEKQLTATGLVEVGDETMGVRFNVTGGRIYDGIDWVIEDGADIGQTLNLFNPVNGDLEFVDVTVQPQYGITDFLRLLGGFSYHHVNYESFANRPYTPEYQAFAGSELHVYWPQRLIHLYAYGELVYNGAYEGLYTTGLGQDPIFNAKVSLGMGRFRFHFIWQNALNRVYESREGWRGFGVIGRYVSYGFTWDFLN